MSLRIFSLPRECEGTVEEEQERQRERERVRVCNDRPDCPVFHCEDKPDQCAHCISFGSARSVYVCHCCLELFAPSDPNPTSASSSRSFAVVISTLNPKPLSAWAVVFAEPGKLDGTRVLHDFVPGDHHSNNRAELYAVLAEVLLGDGGVIYSDSDVAVVGFNLLLDYGLDAIVWWKCSNLDIWVAIQKALRECSGAWRIVKVKSHEDWRSAPDDWHAWLWFHNDMVDDFAKSVFRNASCHIVQSHRKALVAVVATRAVQKTVYDLQRRVADIFRDKKTTTATPSGSLPLFECLQLRFRDRVGMLHADAGCAFPRLPRAPNWDIFLPCAPFAQLLFEWCSRHSWVPDDQGFSMLEFCFAFTADTGWLSPVNIAKWESAAKPVEFRSTSHKEAWIHEVQYPQVFLSAQAFDVANCHFFTYCPGNICCVPVPLETDFHVGIAVAWSPVQSTSTAHEAPVS